MSVTAPSLTTTITTSGYRTEIDANFLALQDFCNAVEGEFTSNPTVTAVHNLQWLSCCLNPDGVIGTDSFALGFSTDNTVLTISHPSEGSGCVIDNRVHLATTTTTYDIDTLCPADGTYRISVGAESQGAPTLALHVDDTTGNTDDIPTDADLLLYTFTLTVSGGGTVYAVTSIQRKATCLISRYTFDALVDQTFPLTAYLSGALPSGVGNVNLGLLVPWDCEAISAYGRIATCADVTAGDITLDLRVGASNIFGSSTMSWTNADSGVVATITGADPYTQLAAGSYVQCYASVMDGDWSSASGLAITLNLRRLWVTRMA